MSMIKCPECGKQVSSKAPTCPSCGVPILNNIKRCPACNALALMDAEQCPQCGAHFVVEKTDTPPLTILPAVAGMAGDFEETALSPASTTAGGTGGNSPAPPKKKGTPWWLLVLAIVLVAVGAFFYYERQMREASEEKDYQQLQNCTELTSYQDFINRYPDSKYLNNVRARIKELQRIENEWNAACNPMDRERLQLFIDENPGSIHKAEAIHKIDSIDWNRADSNGTVAAYNRYIELHDDGEYIDRAFVERDRANVREAKARLDSINAAQAAIRDSIAMTAAGIPVAQ